MKKSLIWRKVWISHRLLICTNTITSILCANHLHTYYIYCFCMHMYQMFWLYSIQLTLQWPHSLRGDSKLMRYQIWILVGMWKIMEFCLNLKILMPAVVIVTRAQNCLLIDKSHYALLAIQSTCCGYTVYNCICVISNYIDGQGAS